jgi:xylulose-5-phosphate/fructose-6-phosphate phosphoketolase
MDTMRRVPQLKIEADPLIQLLEGKLAEHKRYIAAHGEDMPEVANWHWGQD